MPVIRFAVAAPQDPDLHIPGVPATFANYVWDVDDSTPVGARSAARMRYLGQPYGVEELGDINNLPSTPVDITTDRFVVVAYGDQPPPGTPAGTVVLEI